LEKNAPMKYSASLTKTAMDSNDIGEKISKLLEDPGALAGLMSIAGNLMKNQDFSNLVEDGAQSAIAKETNAVGESVKDTADPQKSSIPAGNFHTQGADSPNAEQSLAALAELITKQKANDPRCTLLYALKPYMNHDRAEKIETLVKILKISDLAGGFLGNIF